MVPRPKRSLVYFAGYLLKLFAILVIALMLLLFFFLIVGTPELGVMLIRDVGPTLLRLGVTALFLLVAGVIIESLR
jgi:hypothetical protein